MNHKPAIIVSAFNRANPLKRLLYSIANAYYTDLDITLVISVDKSNDASILEIADNFIWNFGVKKIVAHTNHLVLKEHILSCGDMTNEYNSIIVLEDDLIVSPYYYSYAKQAANYYELDTNIAGISLYNYHVAESCFYPFKAIDDNSDVYFMQVASSWGQLWTSSQWKDFRVWFSKNAELNKDEEIPEYLFQWGQHSWKKHFINYLVSTKKYFVFPRLSLSTNFEEDGTNASTKNVFHVPLQVSEKKYVFKSLKKSNARFDAWFEINQECLKALNPSLNQYNFDVDLFGMKNIINNDKPFLLTSKKCKNKIVSFASDLFPIELNVIFNLSGEEINLVSKRNNEFVPRKLNIRNFLQSLVPINDVSISIIIPVLNCEYIKLSETINSIYNQKYTLCEIIIVCNEDRKVLEKICSNYKLKTQIISETEKSIDLFRLLASGFINAEGEIITWVMPGVLFESDTFNSVNSIFSSYKNLNWINTVDIDNFEIEKNHNMNFFNYRVAKAKVFNEIKSGKINSSIQGHFVKKNCLNGIDYSELNETLLYLFLINQYQLHIVIRKFLINLNNSVAYIGETEIKMLLEKYKSFELKVRIRAKWINFALKLPLIGDESAQWYYTSLLNFPDVLRHDKENNTYYLSKH